MINCKLLCIIWYFVCIKGFPSRPGSEDRDSVIIVVTKVILYIHSTFEVELVMGCLEGYGVRSREKGEGWEERRGLFPEVLCW